MLNLWIRITLKDFFYFESCCGQIPSHFLCAKKVEIERNWHSAKLLTMQDFVTEMESEQE